MNLQVKSHKALTNLLNNIGIVGSILAAIVDCICVIIFVIGIDIKQDLNSTIIFAILNAVIGLTINSLLRYQGQKYAEIENQELCDKFYYKEVDENKKYLTMAQWHILKLVEDIFMKGLTTAFSIFGVIYISIEGSKNPIQILMSLATLILFACLGLLSLSKAYDRFYNIQVPYMKKVLKQKEEQ